MEKQNVKQTPQSKGRQTKLGKKSHEELIAIILKKDKVEKNLNNQIVNLKSEVNILNEEVKNNSNVIEKWKERYNGKCDYINVLEDKLVMSNSKVTSTENNYNEVLDLNYDLKETIKTKNRIIYILVVLCIIGIIGTIFL